MPSHLVLPNRVNSVPADKRTPAYKLFHFYRRVMVQQLFTMNTGTLKEVGTSTSGNPGVDRDLRSQWVTVSLTAVEMTEYLQKGAALMFEDPATATTLYLDIVEHLRGWLDSFINNPSLKRAPLEDLRKFDELAAAVFPYANARLMANEDDAGYGSWLAKAARRRRGLASMLANQAEEQVPQRAVYRSLSDQIAERLAQRLGNLG